MHDAITQIRHIMAQLYREGKTPNLALVRSRCSLSPAILFSLYAQCRHLTAEDLGVTSAMMSEVATPDPACSNASTDDTATEHQGSSASGPSSLHATLMANSDGIATEALSDGNHHPLMRLLSGFTEQFQQQMQHQSQQIAALSQHVCALQAQIAQLTVQLQQRSGAGTALPENNNADVEEHST
jgi:hypothetical protein